MMNEQIMAMIVSVSKKDKQINAVCNQSYQSVNQQFMQSETASVGLSFFHASRDPTKHPSPTALFVWREFGLAKRENIAKIPDKAVMGECNHLCFMWSEKIASRIINTLQPSDVFSNIQRWKTFHSREMRNIPVKLVGLLSTFLLKSKWWLSQPKQARPSFTSNYKKGLSAIRY